MWQLQELIFLVSGFTSVALSNFFDYLAGRTQYRMSDMYNPKILGELVGKSIIAVDPWNTSISMGGGGTGTDRARVVATLADGSKLRLFIKLPATKTFERIFLTLFNVYDNELAFYAENRKLFPDISGKYSSETALWCPKVFCSKKISTGNFVLILEDIDARFEKEPLDDKKKCSCQFQSIFDPYDINRGYAVMRRLAQLHAYFWRNPPVNVWKYDPLTGKAIGKTPPMLRLLGEHGLKVVKKMYNKDAPMPAEVEQTYQLMLENYLALRRFWSSGPLTFCHGDMHVGNMFFDHSRGEQEISMGFVDMQVVSADHCSRDVGYHMMMSIPDEQLAHVEQPLLSYYIEQFNASLQRYHGDRYLADRLRFEDFYFQYRTQAIYVLNAWMVCCGAGGYVVDGIAPAILRRVYKICQRLKCLDALQTVIARDRAKKNK